MRKAALQRRAAFLQPPLASDQIEARVGQSLLHTALIDRGEQDRFDISRWASGAVQVVEETPCCLVVDDPIILIMGFGPEREDAGAELAETEAGEDLVRKIDPVSL